MVIYGEHMGDPVKVIEKKNLYFSWLYELQRVIYGEHLGGPVKVIEKQNGSLT